MLNRQHRFHGYGSLRRVYAKSQSVRQPMISLKFASRNEKPYRVAVVVARKVHKSAVKRNRVRRRIYEIVRKSALVPESTDLIFTVFSDQIIDMPPAQLDNVLNQLLEKTFHKTS
jgi:ribonuclease P protein component